MKEHNLFKIYLIVYMILVILLVMMFIANSFNVIVDSFVSTENLTTLY